MIDLYAILGIDRSADAAAINRAYRQAAKDAHPDAGGSSEAFAELALAKRILLDDEKRAVYDETGRIDDKPADAKDTAALSVVADVITQLIDLPDAIYTDLIAEAVRAMVFKMKRLYRCLMGVCDGISISCKPASGEHFVRIDFATSAEASAFYRELESVHPLREPVAFDTRRTSLTGSW